MFKDDIKLDANIKAYTKAVNHQTTLRSPFTTITKNSYLIVNDRSNKHLTNLNTHLVSSEPFPAPFRQK